MQTALGLLAAMAALTAARRHRRRQLPGQLIILSPRRSTVIATDGAVRSIQSAELTLDHTELDRLWTPANLENLARTYWRFLSRVTLGLIQVKYGRDERRVVLLGTRITLLRFEAPEYSLEAEHGSVRWRIRDGLLVARSGRGQGALAIDVWRTADAPSEDVAKVRIEIGVTNFYSAIASSFSVTAYKATQSAVHVLVTHSFLRSLAALELAQSRVRALSGSDGPDGAAQLPGQEVQRLQSEPPAAPEHPLDGAISRSARR